MITTEAAGPASGYHPCSSGRHWGPRGASGCLAYAVLPGGPCVLLSLRSANVQSPLTWSTPGGAIDPGESPWQAAARELAEEVRGIDARQGTVTGQHAWQCPSCDWTYTTYVVQIPLAAGSLPAVRVAGDRRNAWESAAVGWTAADRVAGMRLHPAFRQAWPELRRQAGGHRGRVRA